MHFDLMPVSVELPDHICMSDAVLVPLICLDTSPETYCVPCCGLVANCGTLQTQHVHNDRSVELSVFIPHGATGLKQCAGFATSVADRP